ncbi:MAG: phosphotransferase [Acidimicrobiales bacterium]
MTAEAGANGGSTRTRSPVGSPTTFPVRCAVHLRADRRARSNPTTAWSAPPGRRCPLGAPWALRRALATAHDMGREWRIMRALADEPTIAVPACLATCDDESVIEAPFYVMEFVDGHILRTGGWCPPHRPARRSPPRSLLRTRRPSTPSISTGSD